MSEGGSDQIVVSEGQRKRFERIKWECTDQGEFPKPSDQAMFDSLMDTWDAVNNGFYTTDSGREGPDT